jgi:hypothetical protein
VVGRPADLGIAEVGMVYKRRFGRTLRNRISATAVVGLVALGVIFAVAFLLDIRGGPGNEAELVAYARDAGADPVALIEAAAGTRRMVVLADIVPAPEPKRLAASVIAALAAGPGLDAVVVEVGSDLQGVLDQYLASEPENAGMLLSDPRLTRERRGAGASLLPVYRAVWRANAELPPARSIRIIAADSPDWPPRAALRPRELATLYATRAEHMADRLQEEVLRMHPQARILILVDGFQAMRGGTAEFQAGGTRVIEARPLAAELDARYPREVFTVLLDGVSVLPGADEIAYRGTALGPLLRAEGVRGPIAVPVSDAFDFQRNPVDTRTGPGLDLEFRPHGYRLREVAHAYIWLGS